MLQRTPLAGLLAATLALTACASDDGDAPGADATEAGAGPCAALPVRGDAITAARAEAAAAIAEAGGQTVAPARAWGEGRLYAPNFFESANVSGRHEQVILAATAQEAEQIIGGAGFPTLAASMQVDWDTEALAIVLEWPRQHDYSWGVSGSTLTLYAAHLQPCDELADDRIVYAEDVAFLRVPQVTDAKVVELDVRYRYEEVQASGACTNGATPIVTGGTSPDVLKDGARTRLWFAGGGLGNSGKLFESASKDGVTWEPAKADDSHAVAVVGATTLVDRNAPSVLVLPNGSYRVYYGGVSFGGNDQRSAIYRATSSDGSSLAGELQVLAPGPTGTWDAGGVSGPTVLRVNTKYYMWYTGEDEGSTAVGIGLATSPDGAAWTRDPASPVLGPGAPGRFDDAGVFAPSVRHDGKRFIMAYTASTGGGDWERARTVSIGVAVSEDGAQWTRVDSPILLGAATWEHVGVHAPALLLDGAAAQLYYTGSDASYNRAIGLAPCDFSTLP